MVPILTFVAAIVEFLANAITVVLGCAAIYAFFYKRSELSLALRGIAQTVFNHRVHRLKETLGKLDRLSYERVGDRIEIVALIGELGGQLRPLVRDFPLLADTLEELNAIIEK